jgi:uncharacterized protein YwqG
MNQIGRAVETFLITLFVTAVAFAMLSNGILKGHDAAWLRAVVLSTAVLIGGFVAWLRWRFDTRGTRPQHFPGIPPQSQDTGADSQIFPAAEDIQLLRLASQGCLAVRHIFPPRHPMRSLSFLGGSPIAPSNFEWPMALNQEGLLECLPFVGQIDCSKLPEGEHSALLPKEGIFYFFLPMAGTLTAENQKLAAMYCPSRPAADWEEHRALSLPPVNGVENARYQFRWMNWRGNSKGIYPTSYPRIEIELGWIDYGGDVTPGDDDAETSFPSEAAKARHRASLIAFHGEPIEYNPLLSPSGKPTDTLWRVHEGFPLSWHAVDVVGGHLRVQIQEERALLKKWQDAPADKFDLPDTPENLRALYDRLDAAVQKALASTFRGLQEPTPEDKAEFWALLDSLFTTNRLQLISPKPHYRDRGLGRRLNEWLSEAATISAEACLKDAEAAKRVPAEVVDALRQRHSVLKRHMFDRNAWHLQHQMLGRGRGIQEAGDEMAHTHILLLQVGPDDAMGWATGDNGAYKYWIRPGDLAARRFDKVIVTSESH